MNLINYAYSFPTVRTSTCAALGYCAADYLKMPPALGASVAALANKFFESLLPSNELTDEEHNKSFYEGLTLVTGIGTGMVLADGIFPESTLSSSSSTIPKLACILGTTKTVQFIAKFLPLPKASIVKHKLIRYPLQAVASIFALNVLHKNSLSIHRDEREIAIFVFTCATIAGVLVSDTIYPILQKYFFTESFNLGEGAVDSNGQYKAKLSPISLIDPKRGKFRVITMNDGELPNSP